MNAPTPLEDPGWLMMMGPVAVLWISLTLIVAAGIYLLPTFLAVARGSERLWPAVLIDVLLGWTVIGWIAAMILALIPPRPTAASPQGGAGRVEPAPSAPVA